tara:strand:+ start:1038 stop:2756 length:1719 start_codon:yes stop_codon:yes gene_type:complete
MSAYKKLNQQDAYISTYTSRKSWVASGSEYRDLGINNIVGISGSGDYYNTSVNNFIAGNQTTTSSNSFNTRLIYDSIRHLYYNDFDNAVLTTSSSYESYLQSSFEVSGSRYLYSRIALFSLPKEMYGTHIEPFSVSITPDFAQSGSAQTGSFDNYFLNNYATDNGVNSIVTSDNLYVENVDFLFGSTGANCSFDPPDYIENESTYVDETNNEYLDTTGTARNCNEIVDDGEGRLYFKYSIPKVYVGNVIYTHGQIVITDEIVAKYYNIYLNAVLKWKSNLPIYTHNYHCKIKSSEYNFTLNKTALENNDGKIADLVSGSSFTPYITTVGLYNDSNELIAVGKLGRPTPKSPDTDMSIIVKLDMNFGSNRLLGGLGDTFLPSDPTESSTTSTGPCVYYFTFRNYHFKGSLGTNQTLSSHPYFVSKGENRRDIFDDGHYELFRKGSPNVTICKKSQSGLRTFNTSAFTRVRTSENFEERNSSTAVCYVDVKVTKIAPEGNTPGYLTFDFTQLDGGAYNESGISSTGVRNRPESFYRDIIRDYLLENTGLVESLSDSCLFVSTGTETCYTGSIMN